jgi:hypothetical protein
VLAAAVLVRILAHQQQFLEERAAAVMVTQQAQMVKLVLQTLDQAAVEVAII